MAYQEMAGRHLVPLSPRPLPPICLVSRAKPEKLRRQRIQGAGDHDSLRGFPACPGRPRNRYRTPLAIARPGYIVADPILGWKAQGDLPSRDRGSWAEVLSMKVPP